MRRFLWILALACSFAAVLRAGGTEPALSSYYVEAPERIMREVARRFAIQAPRGAGYEVIVEADQAPALIALVPHARLLQANRREALERILRENPARARAYHSFKQVEQEVKKHATMSPELASYEEYGRSTQGRPLFALRLTGMSLLPNRPKLLFTAATHGDELITVEVLLGMIEKFVAGYGTDARLTEILNRFELYFIPVVNPDGFTQRERTDNGRDPNRSYPWPGNEGASPTGSISPLIKFYEAYKFRGSIDFHAFGRLVMFPWAYKTANSPDYSQFSTIARTMSSANGYRAGQISQILYVAEGSSADYYYWKLKSVAIAIEMATTSVPSTSQIPSITNENFEATLRFIESFQS